MESSFLSERVICKRGIQEAADAYREKKQVSDQSPMGERILACIAFGAA
nr:MAG TPA: hypothetical protein [Caudoviricetes sp.]